MTVIESGVPTKDVSTRMKNGVAGRLVGVTKGTAPSTELQRRLANEAHSHGLGSLALGEGSGSRKNESVTALACHVLSGIRKSGAVSPVRAGTCSNSEVVFQAVTNSKHSIEVYISRHIIENHWRRGWESNPRIKVLQTSALPLGYRAGRWGFPEQTVECSGAGDGTRTRDIDLGKVALYQLSYSRRSNFLA